MRQIHESQQTSVESRSSPFGPARWVSDWAMLEESPPLTRSREPDAGLSAFGYETSSVEITAPAANLG